MTDVDAIAPVEYVNPYAPLRRWTMRELLDADRTFRWVARGLIVQPTYGMLAGEQKTLKTYLSIAAALGVAAGQPIFDHFNVDEARPVIAYIGEGGRVPYTRRLERLADAMSLRLRDLPLHVCFDVAPIDSTTFQTTLARDLRDLQPGLVIVDPLYAFHGTDADPRNLHAEGALLTELSGPCTDASSSLMVVNHFNKTGGGNGLDRITMSGAAQWSDSWWLVSHREPADVDLGQFRLRLDIGSRQWGGSTWDLDFTVGTFNVDTGEYDGPIGWELHRARVGTTNTIADAILDVLRDEAWMHTKTGLIEKVGGNATRVRAELNHLIETGRVIHADRIRDENGRNVTRKLCAAAIQLRPPADWVGTGWEPE